jgi:hypothetical protein
VKKTNDRRKFIVSLFIIVLSLGVGYAVFAETINITGTATTTGAFNIEFFEAEASDQFNQASLLTTNTATISGDKNLLTLVVPSLERPTAWVEYDITVKNVGTIGANLESVDVTGDTDPDIIVTYPAWTTGVVLDAGATYTFTIKVEWADGTYAGTGQFEGTKNLDFTVALNYEQDY